MLIEIKRLKSNRLYTEGRLYINDMRNTLTVESSELMLPAGQYVLQLVNKNERKRELIIFKANGIKTGWRIGIGNSWIGSKNDHAICIGEYLIPGAVYKAAPIYERIIKRLEKCKDREESIHLIIHDEDCTPSVPISYWLESPDHHCPPSNRRVEVDSEGNATIFEGDVVVKYLSIEQQIENRLPKTQKA